MSRPEAFVEDFLEHYASEYYDPAKAREYYLANRELKDKQSTSDLTVKYTQAGKVSKSGKVGKSVQKVDKARTDERQQAWAYAKKQIGDAKKAALQVAAAAQKERVRKAQRQAQVRRERISTSLTNLLKLLTDTKTANAETIAKDEETALEKVTEERLAKSRKIREDANKKIDAIPLVPDGVGGKQRERLLAIRAKKIAKIKGDVSKEIDTVNQQAATEQKAILVDANAQRESLSSQTMNKKDVERDTAKANREKVTVALKATVDKARSDYEAGKARLIAQYEATSQKEFDAIKQRV